MFPEKIGSLGVVEWPASASTPTTVPCIICEDTISMQNATTGARYADGRQAFACTDHTWNKSSWLLSWVKFSQKEASGN